MIRREEVYRIGRIGKPHGVNGEVGFNFDDDVFDRVEAEYLVLDVDGILVPFFIDDYRFKGNATALVKFSGIDSQERARELTGCEAYFPRHSSDDGEETLSKAEIVGFELVDASDGSVVGVIQGIDDSTANVLFEVERPVKGTVLIPRGDDFVQSVSMDERRIVMSLPDGILDLD